jgi:hypothetical protein
MSRTKRLAMVDRGGAGQRVLRQCALLGLARSGVYRKPQPPEPEELGLMRWIDQQYLATPFYGSRRNDGGAAPRRPSGQPQEGAVADADHGAGSPGSEAEDQPAGGAAPDLPLPAEVNPGNRTRN